VEVDTECAFGIFCAAHILVNSRQQGCPPPRFALDEADVLGLVLSYNVLAMFCSTLACRSDNPRPSLHRLNAHHQCIRDNHIEVPIVEGEGCNLSGYMSVNKVSAGPPRAEARPRGLSVCFLRFFRLFLSFF